MTDRSDDRSPWAAQAAPDRAPEQAPAPELDPNDPYRYGRPDPDPADSARFGPPAGVSASPWGAPTGAYGGPSGQTGPSGPYYGQPGGPHNGPGMPYPPPARRSGMSTAAFVLGIIGLVLCWVPVLGLVLGLLAIAFGIVEIRSSTKAAQPDPWAQSGLAGWGRPPAPRRDTGPLRRS